jgi:chemotaxis protein CheC
VDELPSAGYGISEGFFDGGNRFGAAGTQPGHHKNSVSMRDLSAVQRGALHEFLRMGFDRAAASLSHLTGRGVLLEVPQVAVHPIEELGETLSARIHEHVASVHQALSGPIEGDALLLMDEPGASMLNELLTDEPALPLAIDASAREVIVEVGNIFVNSCLGALAPLLEVPLVFSAPRLSLENIAAVFESLAVGRSRDRLAVVASTAVVIRDTSVPSFLAIVLDDASLDRLIHCVRQGESHQA